MYHRRIDAFDSLLSHESDIFHHSQLSEPRRVVGAHKSVQRLVHRAALACSHRSAVVLFVLHNREPVQPWPRSQSVTSSSNHGRFCRSTFVPLTPRARRALLFPSAVPSPQGPEPDASSRTSHRQNNHLPHDDRDLFADSRGAVVVASAVPPRFTRLLRKRSPRRAKFTRGFPFRDAYVIGFSLTPPCARVAIEETLQTSFWDYLSREAEECALKKGSL